MSTQKADKHLENAFEQKFLWSFSLISFFLYNSLENQAENRGVLPNWTMLKTSLKISTYVEEQKYLLQWFH